MKIINKKYIGMVGIIPAILIMLIASKDNAYAAPYENYNDEYEVTTETYTDYTENNETTTGNDFKFDTSIFENFNAGSFGTEQGSSQTYEIEESETEPEPPTRAEFKGTATTDNVIVTNNDLTGAMEFIKITTKDDQMFYLVIDYSASEDNVYLLDRVTVNDLKTLAETATDADGNSIRLDIQEASEGDETESGNKKNQTDKETTAEERESESDLKSGSVLNNQTMLYIGIICIVAVITIVMIIVKSKGKKIEDEDEEFGDEHIDEEEGEEYNFPEAKYDETNDKLSETKTDGYVDIDDTGVDDSDF